MEKLAAVGREHRTTRAPGPADEMPPEYWESLLNDPRADARPDRSGASIRTQRLSEIPQHILRMSCSRCGRIVEIQKADAVRVAAPQAVWKDVGRQHKRVTKADRKLEEQVGRFLRTKPAVTHLIAAESANDMRQ
jgi:hypothetical protein